MTYVVTSLGAHVLITQDRAEAVAAAKGASTPGTALIKSWALGGMETFQYANGKCVAYEIEYGRGEQEET